MLRPATDGRVRRPALLRGRATEPLRREIEAAFPDRPFAIRFWDGSRVEATGGGGVTFSVNSPRALSRLLWAPGELGLGRAYVAGELEPDDLDGVMRVIDGWHPPSVSRGRRARLIAAAARAGGARLPPRAPRAELRPRGRPYTRVRDARSVRHHYDLSNEFFALFLDDSMTYSCALFEDPDQSLEAAQAAKLELVCRKLELSPGARVLDVGCGWGSFAIRAAREHGARVVGITLSAPQAELAARRAGEAGVAERVDIRVMDYRDIAGERFDAVASIGMVEHVGDGLPVYGRRLAEALRPGGRLLNHGISRLRHDDVEPGPFSSRYVFPDGAPPQLSKVVHTLEEAGLEATHVEGLREHYIRTLDHWAERLDRRLEEATRLVGPERVRVWRLYLRAARNGFETGFTSVYQVLAVKPEVTSSAR